MLQIVASLIDAARGIIYDRHMFIVQATGKSNIFLALMQWQKSYNIFPLQAFWVGAMSAIKEGANFTHWYLTGRKKTFQGQALAYFASASVRKKCFLNKICTMIPS